MSDATALWLASQNGARVYSGTVLGSGCVVHPFAVVGIQPLSSPSLARQPGMHAPPAIGENTVIGPHSVVYAGCIIGRDCFLGDHANIREGVVVGDECVIGQGVTLNYDCRIGNRVRIQTGAHITGGCVVGDGCFIGVGVVMANDKRREIVDYEFVGILPPVIGDGVLIGSGACIMPGVTIGEGAIVGAGALVVRDVAPGERVLGTPAGVRRVVTDADRNLAMLRAKTPEEVEMVHRMGRA